MNMHDFIRENDEYFCLKCGIRVSIDGTDVPECKSKPTRKELREKSLKQVRQLRSKYFGYRN